MNSPSLWFRLMALAATCLLGCTVVSGGSTNNKLGIFITARERLPLETIVSLPDFRHENIPIFHVAKNPEHKVTFKNSCLVSKDTDQFTAKSPFWCQGDTETVILRHIWIIWQRLGERVAFGKNDCSASRFQNEGWSPASVFRSYGDSENSGLGRRLNQWRQFGNYPSSFRRDYMLGQAAQMLGMYPHKASLPSDNAESDDQRPRFPRFGPCDEFVPPLHAIGAVFFLLSGYAIIGFVDGRRKLIALPLLLLGGCILLSGHQFRCQDGNDYSQNRQTFQHDSGNVPRQIGGRP